MKQINMLAKISTLIVLSVGLSACSSDKEGSTSPQSKPWSVGKVELLREGKYPALLKEVRKNEVDFKISDQIAFTDQSPATAEKIQFHVETLCSLDGKSRPVHFFTESMQSKYSLYELLPLNLIVRLDNDENSKLSCTFLFNLKSEDGSTQSFDLTNVNVSTKTEFNIVVVELDPEKRINIKGDVLNLIRGNLTVNGLPGLKDNFDFRLQCQSDIIFSNVKYKHNIQQDEPISFYFNDDKLITEPEVCRIAEINTRNLRTTKLSNAFVVRPINKFLFIEKLSKDSDIKSVAANQRLTIGIYKFTNTSDIDIAVSTDSGGYNLIKYTPVFSLYDRRVGTEIESGAIFRIRGKVTRFDGLLRFVIPAKRSVRLEVLSKHTRFLCPGVHLLGVHYTNLNPKGFMAYVTSVSAGEPAIWNILEEVQYEKPFNKYYFYESLPGSSRPLPQPEKRPGKIHHLKNNFCSEY